MGKYQSTEFPPEPQATTVLLSNSHKSLPLLSLLHSLDWLDERGVDSINPTPVQPHHPPTSRALPLMVIHLQWAPTVFAASSVRVAGCFLTSVAAAFEPTLFSIKARFCSLELSSSVIPRYPRFPCYSTQSYFFVMFRTISFNTLFS